MSQAPNTNPADRPSRIPWPPILLLVCVLAALILQWQVPLPWPGLDDTPARIAGWGLCLAGLALVIWAILTLRQHATTIMPHESANVLVTTGPYAFRRNPIYLGDVLIFIGISVLTTNLWFAIMAVVFIPLVTWLAILPEERHLERRFGNEWHAYKDRTRQLL